MLRVRPNPTFVLLSLYYLLVHHGFFVSSLSPFLRPQRLLPDSPTVARHILSPRRRRKTGGLELGIQTVQWMTNEKKQAQFRSNMIQQYPLVPPFLIDAGIRTVAAGFTQIAPETLQEALQPGGMDKFRPTVREAIVKFALEQRAVQDLPLVNQKDKAVWVGSLVDLALDQLFQDAEWVLAAPEVRLESLAEEMRMIKETEMTRQRVFLYNLRRHPWRFVGIAGLTTLATIYYIQTSVWLGAVLAGVQKTTTAMWTIGTGVYTKVTTVVLGFAALVGSTFSTIWNPTVEWLQVYVSPVLAAIWNGCQVGLMICGQSLVALGKLGARSLRWIVTRLK